MSTNYTQLEGTQFEKVIDKVKSTYSIINFDHKKIIYFTILTLIPFYMGFLAVSKMRKNELKS